MARHGFFRGMPALLAACAMIASGAPQAADALALAAVYQAHCAACHGVDRLGLSAPALLPGNLENLSKSTAIMNISEGRTGTQMPGFSASLSATEISALSELIYSPLPTQADWAKPQILASRIVHTRAAALPNKPVFTANPLNLLLVIEEGDHHINILDGDTFVSIARIPTRYALHGEPKFSSDGRYAYFSSRDGWVSKYDIWNLKLLTEIRVGIHTQNVALSSDDRFLMVANATPHTLVALNADDLGLIRVIDVKIEDAKSSRLSAVYDAAPRQSFVAALKDLPEVWELSYDQSAGPVYAGLVHDYQMGEGIAVLGPFPQVRTKLLENLDNFFFTSSYEVLIGASRNRQGQGQVVDLDLKRKLFNINFSATPQFGAGVSWNYQGRTVMTAPNLENDLLSVIDMQSWKTIQQIKTLAPSGFMASHTATAYLWIAAYSGNQRDMIQIIDKKNLNVVTQLQPSPGKLAAHIEFTRDARHALVSQSEEDGALVIYDAKALKEVTRIPMRKPVGTYKVYNKNIGAASIDQ
jgi:mono/diheme cytochrome c family protein